jgi:hypothetical protein
VVANKSGQKKEGQKKGITSMLWFQISRIFSQAFKKNRKRMILVFDQGRDRTGDLLRHESN